MVAGPCGRIKIANPARVAGTVEAGQGQAYAILPHPLAMQEAAQNGSSKQNGVLTETAILFSKVTRL